MPVKIFFNSPKKGLKLTKLLDSHMYGLSERIFMEKEKILAELARHNETVLSFPDRGPWGSSSYRGNCSGWIPAFFANLYQAKRVAEIFAGSGTTSDVCKDMGLEYVGIDLNPNPVRADIVSMDILDTNEELPGGFYSADMLFLHPPYPGINNVRYSGAMWKDEKNMASRDIQNMPFDKGMLAVNKAIMRGYAALPKGAFEVILVGEIRANGQYYSMFRNLALPGEFYQTFVKMQHNTVSGRSSYGKSTRALTAQEMIAVVRKPSGYEICYVIPRKVATDIRESETATWKDIVMTAARELGEFSLDRIYQEVGDCKRAKKLVDWKAKVRQTLQRLAQDGVVKNTMRGTWGLAAA